MPTRGCAAAGEFFVGHGKVDAAVGDVDFNGVALVHQADGAAFCGFGRGVPDAQTRCAARETPVGEQGAGFAQAFGF